MSGAQHRLENSAMFVTEREIVDLSDGGMSVLAIAAATGKKASYVRQVVNRFTVSARDPFAEMTARGSAALLSAIIRHHPERFRGFGQ